MDALFISEQFIKDNTNIDGNVDNKYLTNTIAECQKLYIKPILGTALYNQISAQIIAGTVSSANQTLLTSYLQDALKYWVLVEGIDLFNYKITNKAVVTKTSDNSQPIAQDDVIRLMDRNSHKAQYFSQQATKFLWANTTTYPLILAPGTGIDVIRPNTNNYETGWSLDMPKNYKGMDVDLGRLNNC